MPQHYGDVCTVWGWGNEISPDAAHVIPKDENGSDDAENGLVSCTNHHRIFDADGFVVEPETAIIILKEGCLKETFDITKKTIAAHADYHTFIALLWRWDQFQNRPNE